MSTADMIYEKAKELSTEQQLEALHYVNYLLYQEQAKRDAAEWATFSAIELAEQYAPQDAIYDQD